MKNGVVILTLRDEDKIVGKTLSYVLGVCFKVRELKLEAEWKIE